MAEPAGQQSTTSLSWRVRVCRVGWEAVRYFWATFFLTLVLPKTVEMLFSDKPLRAFPNLWPILKAIIDHPVWTLLTFLGLLLLTGLFWFGSRERATTTQGTLSEHDRIYMLGRLRLRYKQMLAQSLQGAVQVELGLASRSAAVQNAASLSFRLPNQPEQQLPPHTSIREAYELAQQELLILGEAGAGKSTLLLELALHLIERAEQDTTQPLPVLLPLSSWATNRGPLHEWLSEQFVLLYDVPRSLSQQWLQTKQLLPLLDGLDEMQASARTACIAAISTYHRERLQSLVVCSRTNEYEAAATRERLALHAAVVVQPLSREQVDTHLTSIGRPLAALRAALRKNTVLQELATTPLMLQVLMLTYHGTSVRELSHKEAQLREQIWADYVQRMISRKGDVKRYPPHITITWLGWLARQMRQRNQMIFYLEQLQPDWLPKRPGAFYRWSVGLFFGLFGGLFGGLHGGLLFWLFFGLIGGLVGGLVGGLAGGLFFGLSFGQMEIEPAEALTWSWEKAQPGLVIGWLVVWLVIGLVIGLFYGLVGGLVGGLVCGLLNVLLYGLSGGLSSRQLTERLTLSPNEGIRRSVKNGLLILFIMLISMLLIGLLFGLGRGESIGQSFWMYFGLIGGLIYGLLFGLGSGLASAVQHYILRFWLSCTHTFPGKAVPFLDDAATRILLQHIGGGFSFTHRLLLDYFADLDTYPSQPSTAEPSTPSSTP